MITVICATNRPKNQTQKIVEFYATALKNLGEESQILSMADVPADFIFSESFGNRTDAFDLMVEQYLVKADKLVIVAPEYNGSYPGVFKAFLDANNPSIYLGKKVALVGLAAGRAGNVRGLDHLVQVSHHLGMSVLPLQIPISRFDSLLDEKGNFADSETADVLTQQATAFVSF